MRDDESRSQAQECKKIHCMSNVKFCVPYEDLQGGTIERRAEMEHRYIGILHDTSNALQNDSLF